MKIAIGSDHAAFFRKDELMQALQAWGYEVTDCGTYDEESCDYPDFAERVCLAVRNGQCERGVVLCGTGIGVSMAANKVEGIRCALCAESYSARLTRLHNDANVLAMGARTLGSELALDILKTFLQTDFPGEERNVRRIGKIKDIYSKYSQETK